MFCIARKYCIFPAGCTSFGVPFFGLYFRFIVLGAFLENRCENVHVNVVATMFDGTRLSQL